MTADEIEEKLTYLLDKEEIREVVTQYCRGVDRFDRDLLRSLYHPDASVDHGVFVGDREEFCDFTKKMHETHHHLTQHYVANHVAEIDGDVAHAETYFLYAALNREGAPFSLMGGRYIDRLQKRDGRWAILERASFGEWAAPAINTREGSATPEGGPNRLNLRPAQLEAAAARGVRTSRDRSDPSYQRPFSIPPERKAQFGEIMARAADQA